MPTQYIYFVVDRMIKRLLKEEIRLQGHTLTGTMEESIQVKTSKDGNYYTFSTFMIDYAQAVNEGISPDKIDMRMFAGLFNYFKLRGFDDKNARTAAGATLNRWKTEGMSTKASERFSQSGRRQHFIEDAFTKWDSRINATLDEAFDFEVNKFFLRIKSETI